MQCFQIYADGTIALVNAAVVLCSQNFGAVEQVVIPEPAAS